MPFTNAFYSIILPCSRGNFQVECQNCLSEVQLSVFSKRSQLCKLNIFINCHSAEDFQNKRNIILTSLDDMFGDDCPPTCVLPQPPENSYHIAVEALLVNTSDASIRYGKLRKNRYCVLETASCKELWGAGLEGYEPCLDTETASRGAFDSMLNVLQKEAMSVDNIIRQWNYIGEIVSVIKTDVSEIQNYQIFNEVRHEFYQKYKHITGFPAATGIGCRYNSVTIDFNAFSFKSDCYDILIDNPLQVNPFAYEQNKLMGTGLNEKKTKHPPEFVRGRLISDGNNSVLYVSGTASIVGQEVTGTGDVEMQTRTTIQNINTLVDRKNIRRCCSQPIPIPKKCRYIRVYVKYMEDIPMVKSICRHYFGDVPSIYIQADICRDNLLVEIEAELCS